MQDSLYDFTQKLKDATDLEKVVSEYVPDLQRSGSSFKACCPFHDEKTPSFYVHPDRGFYHCFGCGAGGDVIKFIQEIEKVDFVMSLEMLARRLGWEVPAVQRSAENRDVHEQHLALIKEICTWAARWFRRQMNDDPKGASARAYLNGRGLNDDEIEKYGLGFSPDSYDALLNAGTKEGYKPEALAEAGLIKQRDEGKGYLDRFRNRVMFPIADMYGQVVAFGGRLMESNDKAPKYLNSSDTPVFKKGRLLYGLNQAREAIKKEEEVILLEGYMDWLAMHRQGIQQVLANLGTALTPDQARLIRRHCQRVTLLYDGDAAGQKASFRGAELLLKQGLQVKVALLPDGQDPDDFLKENGTAALREHLGQSQAAVSHFCKTIAQQFPLATHEGKAEALAEIAPLLLAIEDPVLREGYTNEVAQRFGIQPETVNAALRRRDRGRPSSSTRRSTSQEPPAFSQTGQPENNIVSATEQGGVQSITAAEEVLLYLLLHSDEPWVFITELVPDWFISPMARTLYERIEQYARDKREGYEVEEDPFSAFSDPVISQHWLADLLLLPEKRFKGELDLHQTSSIEMFAWQKMRLLRQFRRYEREMIKQDLALLVHDNPGKMPEKLEESAERSRKNLEEWRAYFSKSNRPKDGFEDKSNLE